MEDLHGAGGEAVEGIGGGGEERLHVAEQRSDKDDDDFGSIVRGSSCEWESSASMRAAGWRRDMRERMVALPFVMMTSCALSLEEMILSMPRG